MTLQNKCKYNDSESLRRIYTESQRNDKKKQWVYCSGWNETIYLASQYTLNMVSYRCPVVVCILRQLEFSNTSMCYGSVDILYNNQRMKTTIL